MSYLNYYNENIFGLCSLQSNYVSRLSHGLMS